MLQCEREKISSRTRLGNGSHLPQSVGYEENGKGQKRKIIFISILRIYITYITPGMLIKWYCWLLTKQCHHDTGVCTHGRKFYLVHVADQCHSAVRNPQLWCFLSHQRQMHACYLVKRWQQGYLWEEDKLPEAVWGYGKDFLLEKLYVMLQWHVPPIKTFLQITYITSWQKYSPIAAMPSGRLMHPVDSRNMKKMFKIFT